MIIADHAEEEAYRRAFEGHDIPVIYRGEIRDYYKSYSDSLAMFMLKGLKPETYNSRDITPGELKERAGSLVPGRFRIL